MRAYFLCLFLFFFSCSKGDHFQGLYSEYKESEDHFRGLGSEHEENRPPSLFGELEKEEFLLNDEQALVDFLISADASESMYHHLRHLGHSLSDLFFFIQDYNWQLGITSVDHGDHEYPQGLQQDWRDYVTASQGRFGNLMNLEDERGYINTKILNSLVPNYENVFLHTLSHEDTINCNHPPYCSPRLEQPLRSLKSAMERANLNNSALFRPRADLVTLTITNEEERFEDRKRATTAREVIQTFKDIFGHLNKRFIAFNILITDEDCLKMEQEQSPRVSIAHSIMELADRTGGENISICSEDYGKELRKISKHIKNTIQNSVVLKKEPVRITAVEFSGRKLDWELYGRTLVFDRKELSSKSIEVKVSYIPKLD